MIAAQLRLQMQLTTKIYYFHPALSRLRMVTCALPYAGDQLKNLSTFADSFLSQFLLPLRSEHQTGTSIYLQT